MTITSTPHLVLAGLLLAVAGCRGPVVVQADGDLRIDEAAVEFGETWLGTTARRSLRLTNSGRASLRVTLETTSPFGAPAELTLGGGETSAVELTFSPAVLGSGSAALTATAPGARLTLPLHGTGVNPPSCESTLCQIATLDRDTALCVLSPQADGTACTDGCVVGACSAGRCFGTPVSCDDADPCTLDRCTRGEGCGHEPVACQASNPCSAGSCSATLGCVEAPVSDGTACGAADCVSARVCVAGHCVSRAVPEGAACGRETICQGLGRCVAEECHQAPPTSLARQWTYSVAAGRSLHGLVADPLGNYFTAECRDAGPLRKQCELVSFAAHGAERWRTPFPHSTSTAFGAWTEGLMLAGTRIIATIGPDWIDAFEGSTGRPAWSFDGGRWQHSALSPLPDGGQYELGARYWTSSGGAGELAIWEELWGGRGLGSLDLATGIPRHRFSGASFNQGSIVVGKKSGVLIDHPGWTLPGSFNTPDLDLLTALDPSTQGVVRSGWPLADGGRADWFHWGVKWQHRQPASGNELQALRAVRGGELLVTHSQYTRILSIPTAAVLKAGLPLIVGTPSVVWGNAALFLAPNSCNVGPCYLSHVAVIDDRSRAISYSALPETKWRSDLWLTQRDSALLSLEPSSGSAELREIDSKGKLVMQCRIDFEAQRWPGSPPILAAGRYAMLTATDLSGTEPRLEVWAVPGYAPAFSGWVSPRGSPGMDLAEQ